MGDKDQTFEQLNELRGSKTVIVGIGNTLKGDDGIGPLLCREIKGKICAELINTDTVPENYIQLIIRKKPQSLIIVDAVDFAASAGTIKIFRPEQLQSAAFSTHALSPCFFIDMIRNSIKVDVYFIGVQPGQVGFGQSVCTKVEEAIQKLIDIFCDIFPKDLTDPQKVKKDERSG